MNIQKAQALKVGQAVSCPADRGDPPYTGRVEHVGQQVSKTATGVKYVLVTVRRAGRHASVWPSNRLGG